MGDNVAQFKNGVLNSESSHTGPEGHGVALATAM